MSVFLWANVMILLAPTRRFLSRNYVFGCARAQQLLQHRLPNLVKIACVNLMISFYNVLSKTVFSLDWYHFAPDNVGYFDDKNLQKNNKLSLLTFHWRATVMSNRKEGYTCFYLRGYTWQNCKNSINEYTDNRETCYTHSVLDETKIENLSLNFCNH